MHTDPMTLRRKRTILRVAHQDIADGLFGISEMLGMVWDTNLFSHNEMRVLRDELRKVASRRDRQRGC